MYSEGTHLRMARENTFWGYDRCGTFGEFWLHRVIQHCREHFEATWY